MSDLKSCPFCGGVAVITEYPEPSEGVEWKEPFYVECKNCGTYKNDFATKEEAISDWNRRICPACSDETVQQPCIEGPCPEPRQLTLDELRQMDGQRVWVPATDSYFEGCGIVELGKEQVTSEDEDGFWPFGDYGESWFAYDRPPGGDAHER